jgi:hypothetical protein
MKVGMPVIEVPSTPAEALPNEVVLPELVTTPVRLALVVTVLALPEILICTGDEVETEANVLTPVAYRRPEAAEIGLEVARPPHVRFGVVPPEEITGQPAVTDVTPAADEDVANHPAPPFSYAHT